MKPPRALARPGSSGLASYVATKTMEPVSMKLYELESEEARAREEIAKALGRQFSEKRLNRLSRALHYGLAAQGAPLCPLLRRRTRLGPVTAGSPRGLP